jgi:16S rRNA (cytosine967-C5)-methyltransferase
MAPPQFRKQGSNNKSEHKPKPKIDQARRLASEVLFAILDRGQPLDSSFDEQVQQAKLESLDVRFARHLVATTLRRMGQIDLVIESYLTKPMEHRNREGLHILRMGACQILFMDTAAHAAVNTTVDLLNARNMQGISGLANAILRRIAKTADLWREKMNEDEALQRASLPVWLRQRWVKVYGKEETTKIAQVFLGVPPFDLTVRDSTQQQAIAEELGGEAIGDSTVRLTSVSAGITNLPGFAGGKWWLQDHAASLPASLFGYLNGKTVLDLCAAPGGKTLQLAAAGAEVVALDRSDHRLKRLQDNLDRTGLKAEILVADTVEWTTETDRRFDAVLLDAPCSATGTIRRHPDILWNRDPRTLMQYVPVQREMLQASAKVVKPGGMLVYAVCSQEKEEGEKQIIHFLEQNSEFELAPITAEDSSVLPEATGPRGWCRTLPTMLAEKGGIDGFFFARMIRKLRDNASVRQ